MSRGVTLEDKQVLQRKCVESISKSLMSLKEQALDLDNFKAYWQRVIEYEKWDQIKRLSVSRCEVDDDSISTVADHQWHKLKVLILQYNIITEKGIRKFMDAKLSSLDTLKLNGNKIGNNGAKFLIKINLPMLNELFLENCHIGNEGCRHLTKGNWSKLKILRVGTYLQRCMSIDGTLPLILHNSWPDLQFLETNILKDSMTSFLFLQSFHQPKIGKSFFPTNPSPGGVMKAVETVWIGKFPPIWRF